MDLVSNPKEDWNLRYVVSVISEKHVQNVAINNVLHKAWEGFSAIQKTEAMDRVVIFDFTDEETRERIFDIYIYGQSKETN